METPEPIRLLIVDDDRELTSMLTEYLGNEGFRVEVSHDGAEAGRLLGTGIRYDLVVLDVMLPGTNGLDLLRSLRALAVAPPVVMLTARGDDVDRIVGLELGADDYLPKPFSARELLARLRAVLRRGAAEATDRITVGELSVEIPAHEARGRGEPVVLTGLEFDLLVALMRRAGRVVPRSALMDEAGRGDVLVGDRAVDVHISHLRQKLGDDPRAPRLIKTVRGVGYLLVKP